jgi:hypothetical protein
MGKSSPKPPPPPDYAGAAREQGTANLEAARLTARLSNPNISTPLGGQRVTFGRQATNQAAYDAAMKQYQQALQQYEQRGQAPTGTTVGGPGGKGGTAQGGQAQPGVPNYLSGRDIQEQMQFAGIGGGPTDMGRGQIGMGPTGMGGGMYGGTTFQPGQQGFTFQGPGGGVGAFGLQYDESGRPIAPDISQFQYMTDLDTPFIEQYLTEEAQATLEAQQRVERAYAGLGEQAIGKVSDIYKDTFRPELSAMQTQLQGYGELPSAPDLAAMGQVRRDISPEALAAAPELAAMGQAAGGPAAPGQIAGADVSGVQGVSYGPQEGQYGFARGFVPAERLQQGVDTRGLTALPTGAGMTAQEAILSRLTPTLTREQAALEQQLANQGLVRGGEAYNAAMQQQYQRANDLITQAALQGISVDAAMRQQGFSERQIQAELANQARMGQFGMGTQQAQLANQAVSQNQAQALAVQQSRNAAQAQDLQQRLAMGQFGREGPAACFPNGSISPAGAKSSVGAKPSRRIAAVPSTNGPPAAGFWSADGLGRPLQRSAGATAADSVAASSGASRIAGTIVQPSAGRRSICQPSASATAFGADGAARTAAQRNCGAYGRFADSNATVPRLQWRTSGSSTDLRRTASRRQLRAAKLRKPSFSVQRASGRVVRLGRHDRRCSDRASLKPITI